MGYERFKYPLRDKENKPVEITVTTTNIGIEKKPRYIPITDYAGQEKDIVRLVRDIINHPLNYQGEYVQVILGSRVTMLGLSFYHNINIEIYDPWWNPAATYQARSRGIRATSHEEMLRQLRKNNENARITVHIYQHAALPLDINDAKNQLISLLEGEAEPVNYTIQELANYLNFLVTGEVRPQLIPGIRGQNLSLNIPERRITNPTTKQFDPEILQDLMKKNISEDEISGSSAHLKSVREGGITPPTENIIRIIPSL